MCTKGWSSAKLRARTIWTSIRHEKRSSYAERFPGIAPDPAAVAPYLAALSFDVDDRAATAASFREREVPHSVLAGGSLCVAPAAACGTLFEFV